MKIFKKISILSLTAIGALLVVSCSSNSNSSNESSNTTGDSNSLRVTLTDGKLSDASRQNMIKAEYLIKNDGYKDSDEVSAIITLNSASMMELYQAMAILMIVFQIFMKVLKVSSKEETLRLNKENY